MSDEPKRPPVVRVDPDAPVYTEADWVGLTAERDEARARVEELERERRGQCHPFVIVNGKTYTHNAVFRLLARLDAARALMAEAVRDYHGKSVLFSARFLDVAGEGTPPEASGRVERLRAVVQAVRIDHEESIAPEEHEEGVKQWWKLPATKAALDELKPGDEAETTIGGSDE